MSRVMTWIGLSAMLVLLAAAELPAQEGVRPKVAFQAAQGSHTQSQQEIDIMGHLANSDEIELPYWKPPYYYAVHLPHIQPIHVGSVQIDLSPTKHSVFTVIAALLVALIFIISARSVARAQASGRPPAGLGGAMEATALWIRQEVILPNVGPHGEGYAPYLLTTFFFILACNLLGLLPWGATATANIAVTGGLAVLAFIIIEVSGMRALGFKGYMGTIFYLPPGLPTLLKPIMLIVMTPIELIGKLAKPFALAVRLFANMTAGHALVLALIGLTFTFQSYIVGGIASVMATLVMMLELFVAFLQAFVFTLLTAVFIGLMRAEH
jgi:F-type H+-transporting ATPase subunit a